jgi:hypothetical protein
MTTVLPSLTITVVSTVRLSVVGRKSTLLSKAETSSERFRRTIRSLLIWGVILSVLPTSRYSNELKVSLLVVDVVVWKGMFLPTVMLASWLSVVSNWGVERMLTSRSFL